MTRHELIQKMQKLANKHGYQIHDLLQTENSRVSGDIVIDKLINGWETNNAIVFNDAVAEVNDRIGTRAAVPAVQ